MPRLTSDPDILRLLTRTKRIAVVGLSDRPYRTSHHIARYLQDAGYSIIPINPAVSTVLGEQAYPDLRSVPGPIDLVDVFRRPDALAEVVDDAIAAGIRAIWMQPGTTNADAAERAAGAGIDVVEDLCIMVEHRRLCG
jgi:predicted CoA-binding protein